MRKLIPLNDDLTPEQRIAVEYLSQPKNGGKTLAEIAEMCGVSERQLYRWRIDPVFAKQVRERTLNNVALHLPQVLDTLTERAVSGSSIKAIEVWLRANGLLTPEVQVTPVQPKDDRSRESLEASIAELEQLMERNQGGNIHDED